MCAKYTQITSLSIPKPMEHALHSARRCAFSILHSRQVLKSMLSGGCCRDITPPHRALGKLVYGNDRCPLLSQANPVTYRPPTLTGCNNSCIRKRSLVPITISLRQSTWRLLSRVLGAPSNLKAVGSHWFGQDVKWTLYHHFALRISRGAITMKDTV
jgi:hypothetical protein